jgi:hypothetical protein
LSNLEVDGGVNAYITGNDPNENPVILQANGQWYYGPPNASTIPTLISSDLITIPIQATNQSTRVSLPTDISAGRVWFAEGSLNFSYVLSANGQISIVPTINGSYTDTRWGFLECTLSRDSGFWVDVSSVDFVGIALGVLLITSEQDSSALRLGGLQNGAMKGICDGLELQSAVDGYPWGDLCINDAQGNLLRVLSPNSYVQLQPTAFSGYWTCYVEEVWSKYSSETLIINTQQSELGNVSCKVESDLLLCFSGISTDSEGGSLSTYMSKPSSEDIFSCSTGPFAISADTDNVLKAIIPRLCAAFHRSTLLLDDGNVQPNGPASDVYYLGSNITNWYSKLVHQWEVGGRGYAFAYDDVTSDRDINQGQSQSGLLFSSTPEGFTITVG